jgi:DNA-binding SARP family transcriptional activator/tetratricopeptide (TPR) repeat protein
VTGESAHSLLIAVLGPVRAWRNAGEVDVRPPRQQAVLAMLALRANRAVSRDELVDGIWGAQPPASAVNGVHTYVSALRRALDPDRSPRTGGQVLISIGSGYRLGLEPDQLDLNVFLERLNRARHPKVSESVSDTVRAYDAALELWHGSPLTGVPGPFAEAERARLGELRLAALEERIETALRLVHHPDLVAEVSALVAEHPLRERLRGLLMTALYRAGRQAEALASYAEARKLLVDELGIEPGPHLQRLHHAILTNQDLEPAPPQNYSRGPRAVEPVVPRQLPPPLRHFAGRDTELKVLTSLLNDAADTGGMVLITTIDGSAGVGKTTLAVRWAHRVVDRFPDGQLFVNLRGFDPTGMPVASTDALRAFLDALEVPPRRIPNSLDAQTALYRSLLAGRKMLVVLDNARDAGQVRPLLPGTPGCVAVVTSRNQLTPLVAVEGAHPLLLDLLSVDEAVDLLTRRLGAGRVATEPDAVETIVTHCARLPLALAIVAANATTHPRMSLATLADQLAEVHDSYTRLDTLSGGDAASDVRAVFSWSYGALSLAAARLFRLLSLHPGPDISAPATASLCALPLGQTRPLLAELVRAHLLSEHIPGRFTFHDLLRAYAAEQAEISDSPAEHRAAMRRALDHYLHTAYAAALLLNPHHEQISPPAHQPDVTPEHLTDRYTAQAWCEAEQAVLFAIVRQAARNGFDTYACQIPHTLENFFEHHGHWNDYATTQHTTLGAAQRLGDRDGQIRAHRSLGYVYTQLRAYAEAHTHYWQALDLARQLQDRIGEALTHRRFAWTLGEQDHDQEALDHAQHALDLYRAAGHQIGQARALNDVGWFHARLSDHHKALAYCQQALHLQQQLGDRYGEADTWDSLGYIQHHLRNHTQAITSYRRAIDLYHETNDPYSKADTLIRLADTHHTDGDRDAARNAWQQALAILTDIDHPDAAPIRDILHRLDHPDTDANR